jgi:hypothetical protein
MACPIILPGSVTDIGILKSVCRKYGTRIIDVIICPILIANKSCQKEGIDFLTGASIMAGIMPVRAAVKVK